MTAELAEEPSAKMLKCSHCPKEFRYNSERNRHELSHSPGFECDICCKKFSFVSALRRHQKQHERTGSVKCQECSRKFRDEVLLKRHMKYAHKGTFTCPKCDTIFSSDQALRTHLKTHKPESERRFKCSFNGCVKSFNFSHHLKHHELTHTDAKQHYCNVCGKGFIQSHHLKTHLKTHDPSEWLCCEFSGCKKTFSTEYARKRHMATHKMKPDSGISSDSNSCDASISSKDHVDDSILCASCGDKVPQTEYLKHTAEYGDDLEFSTKIECWPMSSLKQEQAFEKSMLSPKSMVDKDVHDCRSALGGCIMGTNSCICAKMSKPTAENFEFTPIENSVDPTPTENNNIYFIDKYSEVVLKFFDSNNKMLCKKDDTFEENTETKAFNNSYKPNTPNKICVGCDCASSCNIKEPSKCNINHDMVPNVEFRIDGVIKIKDTFDIDMPKVEHKGVEDFERFVPFSTCRDVIGNCLAGGSEGCLCARMTMDEHQGMAQEIDDITPKPKTECYI